MLAEPSTTRPLGDERERERDRGFRPKGRDLPFSINLRYANLIGRQPLCTTQGTTAPLSARASPDRPSAPSTRPPVYPFAIIHESVPLIATLLAERNFVAEGRIWKGDIFVGRDDVEIAG